MTNLQSATMRTLTIEELNEVAGGLGIGEAIAIGTAFFTLGRYLHSQHCDDH